MLLNFTTLFDINYMAKGLAMYNSLLKACPQFHLYIFSFDDDSYKILTKKNLAHTTIISLKEFENEQLLSIKKDRTITDYCYTCTPFIVKYCLENYNIDHCTYIDADIYFYNDPTALITNMGDNSVLITPHNYYGPYDLSGISGIYCVQFVTFKNTDDGLKVLNWWANACLKWCYARYEDGKMGDQKYLDSWPYMFEGVQICREVGAGMAPWNALKFELDSSGPLKISNGLLYFYHFHKLFYLSNDKWYTGGEFLIPNTVLEIIYKPYIKCLLEIDNDIRINFNHAGILNKIDVKTIDAISLKSRTGIYFTDLKNSFRKFVSDLLFISRRKQYKSNYIKLN